MARWTFAVGAWNDDPQRELSGARARSLRWRLDEPATVTFRLDGRGEEATLIEEHVTDLHVWRDGTKLYRGRVGATEDDIDTDRHALPVNTVDYRGVLTRRFIYDSDASFVGPTFSSDAGDLAWDLVGLTQGRTGGDLGIVQGIGLPVLGRNAPSVKFTGGQSITEAIDSFARTDPDVSGFEWEIDAELALNIYGGRRGQPAISAAHLDYGGVLSKVKRTSNPAEFANVVVLEGASNITTTTAADIATTPEGRWESYIVDRDAATAAAVAARSLEEFDKRNSVIASWSVTFATSRWEGPSHVWLGDECLLVVRSGRRDDYLTARVVEIGVQLDENGRETVTMSLGSKPLRVDEEISAQRQAISRVARWS